MCKAAPAGAFWNEAGQSPAHSGPMAAEALISRSTNLPQRRISANYRKRFQAAAGLAAG